MPLKPNKDESKDEFISRCMREENKSFPDNKQRAAVCFSKWKKHLEDSGLHKEQIAELISLYLDNKDEEADALLNEYMKEVK